MGMNMDSKKAQFQYAIEYKSNIKQAQFVGGNPIKVRTALAQAWAHPQIADGEGMKKVRHKGQRFCICLI